MFKKSTVKCICDIIYKSHEPCLRKDNVKFVKTFYILIIFSFLWKLSCCTFFQNNLDQEPRWRLLERRTGREHLNSRTRVIRRVGTRVKERLRRRIEVGYPLRWETSRGVHWGGAWFTAPPLYKFPCTPWKLAMWGQKKFFLWITHFVPTWELI